MAKSTARSAAFRRRMREAGCARLEVTIGGALIIQLRATAAARAVPLWLAVEQAVEKWIASDTK